MAFSPETYALLKGQIGGGGGGGDTGVFVIPATFDEDTYTTTLGKTWNEINTAIAQGNICIISGQSDNGSSFNLVYQTYREEGNPFEVQVSDFVNIFTFTTDSGDGYPSYTDD